MTRIMPIVAAFLLLISTFFAHSQSASKISAKDLLGEWQFVKHNFQMAGNKKWDDSTFDLKLIISAADNQIFEGKYIFQSKTHYAHDGIKDTKAREIDVLGTVSLSGDKIFFVLVGEADSVYYEGRLINEHTIEWLGYESGEHGWILRGISVKQ